MDLTQLAGQTIGKYQFKELIGEGGMAYVYKAYHLDFEFDVAVKILFSELSRKPEVQTRFRSEAKIQFKLQHPNLVRVFDLIDEQDILGMAMDWVEGQDLKSYLETHQEPLPPSDLQRLFIPILEGVGYAHKQRIVHRDLKPSNILIEQKNGLEQVRVMDFGIAKLLDDDSHHTKTGAVLGTPFYIAPEAILDNQKIDHRADIYSLGITLYEMATQHLPFVGSSPIQVLMQRLNSEPPPPSQLCPRITPSLERIILKSIAREPEQRYQSCEEFLNALQQYFAQSSQETGVFDLSGHVIPPPSKGTSPKSKDGQSLPTGILAPEQPLSTPQPGPAEEPSSPTFHRRLTIGLLAIITLTVCILLYQMIQTPKKPPSTFLTNSQRSPQRSSHRTSSAPPRRPDSTHDKKVHAIPSPKRSPRTPPHTNKSSHRIQKPTPHPTNSPPDRRKRIPRRRKGRHKGVRSHGSFKRCQRCVKQKYKRLLRPSGLSMPGEYTGYCNHSDFITVGRQCASSCRRNYLFYSVCYLNQHFRNRHRRWQPAGTLRLCRGFLLQRSSLRQLRRYYRGSATSQNARKALKRWRSFSNNR